MRYRVKIRRHIGLQVKPEAEQIEGKVFNFTLGWNIEDDELYPGEQAMIARDENYPNDAPGWISSGDLEAV